MFGEALRHHAIFRGFIEGAEFGLARHPNQIGIFDLVIGAGSFGKLVALRPLDFERREGEEKGAGEIALGKT